jgi:hypothetical protein
MLPFLLPDCLAMLAHCPRLICIQRKANRVVTRRGVSGPKDDEKSLPTDRLRSVRREILVCNLRDTAKPARAVISYPLGSAVLGHILPGTEE